MKPLINQSLINVAAMPAKRARRSLAPSEWIHSTRLHVEMYSMLLVATPFLLLQSYLQEAIGLLSSLTFPLAGMQIPVVPTFAITLLIVLLICYRSRLTRRRILAGVVVFFMAALGQQIADYYFAHRFYDLQQNWHYLAYCIFAFMVYRDLSPRGIPLYKILLIVYFGALLVSTFDETFQKYIATRIFDISDIAKDVWGSLCGIVLFSFGSKKYEGLFARGKRLRRPKLEDYIKNPKSLLLLLFVLGVQFLSCSSLLSDSIYWSSIILCTVGSFVLFFFLFHISQYRWGKYGVVSLLVVAVLLQSLFFIRYRNDNIVYNGYGLTVYKGIPIFFFDVMIFPNGMFRLVDKKHDFNYRDRKFLMRRKADIVLIGSGAFGKGGNGFPSKAPSQFFYNQFIERGTQVIILKTPEACRVFNRLKREHKNVLFVLHNTC